MANPKLNRPTQVVERKEKMISEENCQALHNKSTQGELLTDEDQIQLANGVAQFCEQWQDARDVGEIITEIYADRQRNNRAEWMYDAYMIELFT